MERSSAIIVAARTEWFLVADPHVSAVKAAGNAIWMNRTRVAVL